MQGSYNIKRINITNEVVVRRNGVVRAMDKELSQREWFIEYRSFEKVMTE